ncbi:antitoxin VbhA family protein [Arthrobacter sp. TMN-49]
MMKQKLTPAQVVERQSALADIRHSTEMEGGRSSDQARALQGRWARGEIDADEMVELTKEIHQL